MSLPSRSVDPWRVRPGAQARPQKAHLRKARPRAPANPSPHPSDTSASPIAPR
jgi:hypothetical protein